MKKILTKYGAYVLVVALMMPLAQAQPAKFQAAFGDDAGTLSKKFTGLARVMSGKYERSLDHPVNVRTLYLLNQDLLRGKQQRHHCPCAQDQNPFLPSPVWRGL